MPDNGPYGARTGRSERTICLVLTDDELAATLKALRDVSLGSSKRYPHWTARQKLDEAGARALLLAAAGSTEQGDTQDIPRTILYPTD